ncbi:MAG TPA: DUF4870 domain-containing protein [Blastocatellia bacterium]|nr:DUF4870 domain-containing protein [Blastocatellia bacterium]
MQPVTQDEKTFGMLAHLSALSGVIIPFGNIIGPLIIWMMKKDQSWFVNEQGKESLNFQISITIYLIIAGVLILVLLGILLMPLVGLFALVMTIIAGIKASQGEMYRYPLTIRLIK